MLLVFIGGVKNMDQKETRQEIARQKSKKTTPVGKSGNTSQPAAHLHCTLLWGRGRAAGVWLSGRAAGAGGASVDS